MFRDPPIDLSREKCGFLLTLKIQIKHISHSEKYHGQQASPGLEKHEVVWLLMIFIIEKWSMIKSRKSYINNEY